MNYQLILPIIIISIILVAVLYYSILKPKLKKNIRIKKNYKYFIKKNKSLQGGTSFYYPPNWDKSIDGDFFNYHLKSFDGGKNWYAINQDKLFNNKELIILGTAEDIYPGLLKNLTMWNKLTDYAKNNGHIDPTDKGGREVLEDTGFTVKDKSDK